MADILISDLHPTGHELFSESESYLSDLEATELNATGGVLPVIVVVTTVSIGLVGTAAAAYAEYCKNR